jgi:hypothetical protein
VDKWARGKEIDDGGPAAFHAERERERKGMGGGGPARCAPGGGGGGGGVGHGATRGWVPRTVTPARTWQCRATCVPRGSRGEGWSSWEKRMTCGPAPQKRKEMDWAQRNSAISELFNKIQTDLN